MVELPVCPECHRVGRFAASEFVPTLEHFCRGPRGAEHPKVRMERREFREARR